MKHLEFEPLAQRLGYAGLVPFGLLSLLLWLVKAELHPFVATALLCYGAVIASFLGGIHWGIAFSLAPHKSEPAKAHLLWSVSLAGGAWVAPPGEPLSLHDASVKTAASGKTHRKYWKNTFLFSG